MKNSANEPSPFTSTRIFGFIVAQCGQTGGFVSSLSSISSCASFSNASTPRVRSSSTRLSISERGGLERRGDVAGDGDVRVERDLIERRADREPVPVATGVGGDEIAALRLNLEIAHPLEHDFTVHLVRDSLLQENA